jgi:dTDP-4-amino-4,6-dideoxygalactose transaminase
MTGGWVVPRADLQAQYRALAPEIDDAIRGMLERAELIGGPTLERFERAVADRVGVQAAVATSSGTAALQLALLAAGVGPGAEVIVPAFTFAATAAAVVHCGAKPVFVDVCEDTACIDPRAVAEAVTGRTRAVVAVHLFGRMADVGALVPLDVPVIEDAAQAFGAHAAAGRAGAVGRFGCFSFHPSKNLGVAGDGGMVVTDDGDAATRIRRLVDHGRGASREHEVVGFNHRFDAIQAAIGLVKLAHVDAWTERRRALAARYDASLAGVDLGRPPLEPGHVFHQYAVTTDARDELADHLYRAGIATAKFYPRPVYAEPGYAIYAPRERCPVSERLCRRTLCIPIHAELSHTQQEKVLASIHGFYGARVAGGARRREDAG